MTMHLEGPWLTTTGKKKGKVKWRSAEEKRRAEQLEKEWQQLLQKHKSTSPKIKIKPMPEKSSQPLRRTTERIPSLNGGVDMSPAFKTPNKVYTGTKIIGIGTMHKSNAVPIFSDNEAKDISSMRR